jgi:hypothetical protein
MLMSDGIEPSSLSTVSQFSSMASPSTSATQTAASACGMATVKSTRRAKSEDAILSMTLVERSDIPTNLSWDVCCRGLRAPFWVCG